MKHVLSCLACLILGLVVGVILSSSDQDKQAPNVGDEPSVRRNDPSYHGGDSEERVWWSTPRQRAERSHLYAAGSVVRVPKDLLGQLSGTSAVRSAGSDFFNGDEALLEVLGISESEKLRLESQWADVRQKIQALEVRSATPEQLDDGSVKITVPDLSQNLRPLGQQFESQVEQTLGKDLADVLLAVKRVDHIFAPETGERVHRVAVEAVGDGTWRYHMTYEDAAGRRVWVGESVPNEIRHITDAAGVTPSLAEANKAQK